MIAPPKLPDDLYYPLDLCRLPPQWEAVLVGDAIRDIEPGFASGIHNQEGEGIPHLRPMNIDRDGRLDLAVVKYVSASFEKRIRIGDVLFNNTNSPELVGKTTAIERDAEFAFSNHMTRLRPPLGISPQFVALQLHFLFTLGYFRHRCTKHVNQASISSGTLADTVPLLLAPTAEQRRIVAEIEQQFTRLEAAVAALKRVRANLKRYRASVLKAACEGRLVPTEAELARTEDRDYEPADQLLARILQERRTRWEADRLARMQAAGKLPKDDKWKAKYRDPLLPDVANLPSLAEGWTWVHLGAVADVKLGKMLSPKAYEEGLLQLPYLRNENVRWGTIDFSDVNEMGFKTSELERYSLEPNDLLVCEGGEAGRCAVYSEAPRKYMYQKALHRVRPIGGLVSPHFIQLCLSHYVSSGTVIPRPSETTIQHLPLEEMLVLPIPLAPLAEQQRIVAEVERRLSVIEEIEMQVEANLKRAERLRRAILKRAFEGNLVPQNPNDEPASALLERIRAERLQRERLGQRKKRTLSHSSILAEEVTP